MRQHYADRMAAAIRSKGTAAVVGIDPVLESLPAELRPSAGRAEAVVAAIETFSRGVVDRVAPIVPAVKINSAFFEAYYEWGVAAFFRLVQHAHRAGLLVISDIKRGDIGSTARFYAAGHLSDPQLEDVDPERIPDAVTLSGYLGASGVDPFIEAAREHGRGLYVLVRPSDPGADQVHEFGDPERFYQHMGRLVSSWGARDGLIGGCGLSCVGAVVAPKDAASTRTLRAAMPHTPFLVPGYGAQGAGAESCRATFRADGSGAIVNASRSVIYAHANPSFSERFGDDWGACVEQAARDFAADIARLITPG